MRTSGAGPFGKIRRGDGKGGGTTGVPRMDSEVDGTTGVNGTTLGRTITQRGRWHVWAEIFLRCGVGKRRRMCVDQVALRGRRHHFMTQVSAHRACFLVPVLSLMHVLHGIATAVAAEPVCWVSFDPMLFFTATRIPRIARKAGGCCLQSSFLQTPAAIFRSFRLSFSKCQVHTFILSAQN